MNIQICDECAHKRGLIIPVGHIASYWIDTCDVCQKFIELTDINDFVMNRINPAGVSRDFKPKDTVKYVPSHAVHQFLLTGDHPKIEIGIVKSTNDKFVFVNYYLNDEIQETAKATDPKDLAK